jgi:hypothetical protein
LKDLVAEIFEFYKDGRWHTIKDVCDRFAIEPAAAVQVVRFLATSSLLKLAEDGSAAMIDPTILRILARGSSHYDFM